MTGEVVVLGAPAATPTTPGSTVPVRTATPTASPTAEASHTVTSATATPTALAQQSPTVPAPTPQQAEAGPASGGASPARALPSTGSARNQSPITFTRLVLGIWSAAALLLVVTGIGRLRRS
jgi:hypothetical protein